MNKSGFLYIYTSNESASDVYFDNLLVAQASGPVLEETHYYPFGLTMAGISFNALVGTNYPKNRKEYNGIEHTTDLDLNQYDVFYRNLDPQIGRWNQVDPKIDEMEAWSPYASNYNNPISYNDFLGDEPDGDPPTGARGFWISTAGLINGINHTITFGLYDTPASAFGFDEEETARYETMIKIGEIIPVVFQPKPSPAKPTLLPLNFEPLPVPVPAPTPIPVVAPLPVVNAKRKKDWGKAGGAEHTSGARGSTKGKHANARREQDRNGAKGMGNLPRRRPDGHKGPWPPKPPAPAPTPTPTPTKPPTA
ncbi:RHS repeat domain-containing protein [Chitinophaga sp. Hz27]|uniref:RHS repeat domain-containing protein n=1 Tax=Chitinophaga sp. Hz27 TaxID=3347169 RepID=UPI0035DE9274